MTTPETSLQDLVGARFGPYFLTRRLGIGGMAETFEAVRRGPGGFEQRVCLKLVLPFFHQDPEFIELFHREAKLAAQLRHSNVVGVIDFGEVEGRSYMALELVDGCDLRSLLDSQERHRLSPEHVALIGLDLAEALEHAHDPSKRGGRGSSPGHSIVHRDVSPSNVLISSAGEIKLTDFGVAKAVTGTSRRQSAVKGKIPYMSPEQLKAEAVDGRSDLFSLGIVMFEALAGQHPYETGTDPGTILAILKGERPSVRSVAPEAPAGLCEAIEKLLQPEVGERFQDALQLTEVLDELKPSRRSRRELGEIVEEVPRTEVGPSSDRRSGVEPTAGARPSPEATTARVSDDATSSAPEIQDPRKTRSRRRMALLMGGLILAAGGVAAGLLFLGGEAPDAEPPPAEPAAAPNTDEAPSPSREPTPSEPDLQDSPSQGAETAPTTAPPVESSPPEATRQSAAPARLSVVVIPWGSVWIDGKRVGRSPLKDKALKPGRYTVSAGQESPTESQVVRLRRGQQKTLRFDLR